MKYLYSVIILFFFFSINLAEAGIVIKNQKQFTSFETQVAEINRIVQSKDIQFDIAVSNIIFPDNVAYWKVRSYCDSKMTIQLTASSTNDCKKAVRLDSLTNNTFSFLFDNKTSKMKNFSIKLKAYDKNGKWLHTEKESFRWK